MPKEEKYELKQVEVRLKLNEAKPLYSDKNISDPEMAADIMRQALSELDREYFCVVNLDTKNRPIHFNVVSIGDIDSVNIPMQNVFKSAILSNAASIVAFHNHPSGDITPSRADINITEKLAYAGKLMNIPVLDHIIVGDNKIFSLREYDENLFTHDLPRFDLPEIGPVAGHENKTEEFKNIVDYAKEKKIDVHVINGFVSAHRDEFVGHIKRDKVGAAVDRWGLEKIETYISNKPQDTITRFSRYSKELNRRREANMDIKVEEKKDRELTPMEMDKLYQNSHSSIDTVRGVWPLAEYLDMYCSQRGFDDYKDLRRQGFSVTFKESSIMLDEPSNDVERGIDVPDMNDGIDDRISVSGGNPSKDPSKAKAKSVKHYYLTRSKSVIAEELKQKEAEVKALREEMKSVNAADISIDVGKDINIDIER